MTYYQRIRNLREDSDLSQTKVAKLVHVAQTTYSDYEHGRIRVPIEVLIDLAEFYDVDMNYISGITDERGHFPESARKRRNQKETGID